MHVGLWMPQNDVCGLSMDVSMNDDSARALESNKKYLFVCFFFWVILMLLFGTMSS